MAESKDVDMADAAPAPAVSQSTRKFYPCTTRSTMPLTIFPRSSLLLVAARSRRSEERTRSSPFRDQEVERRGHVVLGYLRRHGKFRHGAAPLVVQSCFQSRVTHDPVFFCFLSAPFAATRSTSLPSSTKPIPVLPTTMVSRLLLETVATSSTWIASSVG